MATVERSRVECDDWLDERGLPWLENGERMDQQTFHERYAKMPPGTKAELIGGIVYIMASPLSTKHARGDARMSGWLFHYSVATPGVEVQLAATTILGPKSEPQPDSAMLILPEWGGRTRQDPAGDGFTMGGPELVVEVSVSSRSYDLHQKLDDYEKGGVGEYLVLDLRDSTVRWFARVDDRFQDLEPGADGVLSSRTFPGLWLDAAALIANDKPQLIATLDRGIVSPEHAEFVARLNRRRAELAAGSPPTR